MDFEGKPTTTRTIFQKLHGSNEKSPPNMNPLKPSPLKFRMSADVLPSKY